MKRLQYHLSLLACAVLFCAACDSTTAPVPPADRMPGHRDPDNGGILTARSMSIRSYPGGGGVFVIMLKADSAFTGCARLHLGADAALRAVLTRATLQRDSAITEIELHPDTAITPGTYDITLFCMRTGEIEELHLQVEVMEWRQYPAAEEIAKREAFLPWLHATHPELGDFPDQDWTRFMTYPQMLIVEHWSFVNRTWELRICFHVMVAPDDWSMLLLRRRGEAVPRFAARRESDGSIHEIPVAEYPQHFGY